MLYDMLKHRRPHGSRTEAQWIDRFIRPLGVTEDAFGNLHKSIGDSKVLWSCHTDTVHRTGGQQRLVVEDNIIRSAKTVLGADDTAGAWIMTEMIAAGVPGHYIFHRGEEQGGLGSGFIHDKTPEVLKHLQAAIALDRRGTTSIITHQFGRCCSDQFGRSLSAAIGLGHKLDDTGVFTDTANYTDLIGECTNISVGYYGEHTTKECLLYDYVVKLRNALVKFDESKLEFEREPGESDWTAYGRGFFSNTETVEDLVRTYPHRVARYLEGLGLTYDELYEVI